MTSHHVICHVITVIYLFIVNKKKNQKKRNIKSRKIDKRKIKILVSKCTIILYRLDKAFEISYSYTSFLQLVQNYKTFRISIHFLWLLWQPLITKINNNTTNKFLKRQISYKDHKRTQQGVSNTFLHYLYNTYIVCANE